MHTEVVGKIQIISAADFYTSTTQTISQGVLYMDRNQALDPACQNLQNDSTKNSKVARYSWSLRTGIQAPRK